jgi:hypothetical protein
MSACSLDRRSTGARARAIFFHAIQSAKHFEPTLHVNNSLPKGSARLIFSAKTWFNTGRDSGPEMVPDKI